MNLPLTKLSETATKITFGWTPVGDRGYRFTREKAAGKWSNTWDATRDQVTFTKDSAWYRVEALGLVASGDYPPTAPPPSDPALRRIAVPSYSSSAQVVTTLSATLAAFASKVGGELVVRGDIQIPAPAQTSSVGFRDRDCGGLSVWFENGARFVGWPRVPNAGQQVPQGLYFIHAKRLKLYNVDVTNPAGGGMLVAEGCQDITIQGKVHDVCGTCFMASAYNADVLALDLDLDVSHCGLGVLEGYNPDIDPHAEKGTGCHPYYVGAGPGVYGVRYSKLTFVAHDCGTGQGQVGQVSVDNEFWIDARRFTFAAQSQLDAAGHGWSAFGTNVARNKIHYIYGEDLQGRVVNIGGPDVFDGNVVEYGRGLRCSLNPKIGDDYFEAHAGITYLDCQPL